jgi:hypothetical protein
MPNATRLWLPSLAAGIIALALAMLRVARVTVEKARSWCAQDVRPAQPAEGDAAAGAARGRGHPLQVRLLCELHVRSDVAAARHVAPRGNAAAGGCTATARINDLDIRVELEITIWVPRGARQKLVDHEEGHRVIGERSTRPPSARAREAARKWAAAVLPARAEDCAAAADAAVRDANHQLCQAYLEATSGWSSRVGDLYDEITDHGRRDSPAGEEAIELAFQRDGNGMPDSALPDAPGRRGAHLVQRRRNRP